MSSSTLGNPYVGPRTFTEEERDIFFGRNREAKDLLSLVMSERLVLFYAQSGAGKSSLINTRLRPDLQRMGFEILPTGRVRGALPPGIGAVENIFIFNLILHLDQDRTEAARFIQIPLQAYLEQRQVERSNDDPTPSVARLLIIDQFEEILTANQEYWQKRVDFFTQLAQAMEDDPRLWIILSMREDYVASLEPYAHLLPGRFMTRFYMQRLSRKAALEAIKKPAEKGGRRFAPGVAEVLADNLRQIRGQGQEAEIHPGEFIEPVQLQVVCYQLWEKLKTRPQTEITEQDVRELGDVDTALAQFYEQIIAETIEHTRVSEIDLRDWFERQLITEAGTRGLVYQGKRQTGGLTNETVEFLASKFLLRADVRAGGTWYELVHDRLVGPIIKANQEWRLKQPLLHLAQEWVESGRSDSKLLDGQQLTDALLSNWKALGPIVAEFLEASQGAQRTKDAAVQAEKEAQRQRELETVRKLAEEAEARHQAETERAQEAEARQREQAQAAASLRKLAALLAGFGGVAVALAIVAVVFGVWASQSANEAQANARTAQANENLSFTRASEIEVAYNNMVLPTVAAGLEATLTAQASTVTSTLSPTTTPPITFTPHPAGSATITPTQTPDLTATAMTEALQTQLAQVRATQTAAAQLPGGRLAIPVANNVVIYSTNGKEQLSIPNAHQPNFGFDREYSRWELLVKRDGQNIWRVNPDSGQFDAEASSHNLDEYPFYNPDGSRIVYGNPKQQTEGKGIFVQCGLVPVQQDITPTCNEHREILLIRAKDSQILGSYPVWTGDDQIAYQDCVGGDCGIFIVPSWSTASQGSKGENPTKLPGVAGGNTIPTDAHDIFILYQVLEANNWEVYLTTTGSVPTNLSQSPNSHDGLATFSPDGQWVAFASNQEGRWAIWAVPRTGGQEPQKLFDLPSNPDLRTERISWGQ